MAAPPACKMRCGRLAAAGSTKAGVAFDTCCRGCASGKGHDARCSGALPASVVDPGRPASEAKARMHVFKVSTFTEPKWCARCESFLWGISNQGSCCHVCSEVRCSKCAESG